MKDLISIIVTCYNKAMYLDECLQSVLEQTYCNWECIIINDGSEDATEQVVKEWLKKDNRFKYIYQVNAGVSAARNAAIALAKGELIYPLDADDKIGPSLFEKILLGFKTSNNVQVVYCNVKFFGYSEGPYKLAAYSYEQLLLHNCFVACSAFKKSDWVKVGGYDEELKSFEDWDFWIRILSKQSKVYKIEEDLFYYRKHESASLTNNFKIDKVLYSSLYNIIYNKNKAKYDKEFGNPILTFRENTGLKSFKSKVQKLWAYQFYIFIKKFI